MSAASCLHSSFLQAVNAVMLWLVRAEKVPQASEHLCPAKLPTMRSDTAGTQITDIGDCCLTFRVHFVGVSHLVTQTSTVIAKKRKLSYKLDIRQLLRRSKNSHTSSTYDSYCEEAKTLIQARHTTVIAKKRKLSYKLDIRQLLRRSKNSRTSSTYDSYCEEAKTLVQARHTTVIAKKQKLSYKLDIRQLLRRSKNSHTSSTYDSYCEEAKTLIQARHTTVIAKKQKLIQARHKTEALSQQDSENDSAHDCHLNIMGTTTDSEIDIQT